MPELPEVETTCRGIAPQCVGAVVTGVAVRDGRLRWPVPADLPQRLCASVVQALTRRAKYLLMEFSSGTLLVHLGMSGSLRLLCEPQPAGIHDHIDLQFDNGFVLRYNDPRRFGSFQWFERGSVLTPLQHLGPEPLDTAFDGAYLYHRSRGRRLAVKPFLMDGKVVVGVGNIYATEALFLAGIRPSRPASQISLPRYENLATHVKQVLTSAIRQGGTTLRDFVGGDGKPGYFAQQLYVYGRAGQPCKRCQTPLRERRLGQRSSVYCVACQR